MCLMEEPFYVLYGRKEHTFNVAHGRKEGKKDERMTFLFNKYVIAFTDWTRIVQLTSGLTFEVPLD